MTTATPRSERKLAMLVDAITGESVSQTLVELGYDVECHRSLAAVHERPDRPRPATAVVVDNLPHGDSARAALLISERWGVSVILVRPRQTG